MDNDELLGLWPDAARMLDAVLDLPPDRRAAYLDRACAGRPRLRTAVDHLLAQEGPGRDLALPDELLAGEPAAEAAPSEVGPATDHRRAGQWRHEPVLRVRATSVRPTRRSR
ncbi:MAG: hypothetical protein R2712_06275 [Vicinamibacterales bacterium]